MLSTKTFQIFEIHFKCDYSFFDKNILYSKLEESIHFRTKFMFLMGN